MTLEEYKMDFEYELQYGDHEWTTIQAYDDDDIFYYYERGIDIVEAVKDYVNTYGD